MPGVPGLERRRDERVVWVRQLVLVRQLLERRGARPPLLAGAPFHMRRDVHHVRLQQFHQVLVRVYPDDVFKAHFVLRFFADSVDTEVSISYTLDCDK